MHSLQIKNTQHLNTYNTWEGLSIDIIDNDNKNIRICNIYRPPKRNNNHATIDNFLEEFKPKIRELAKSCKNLILAGDFNIDLLKVNSNSKFQEFYDFLVCLDLNPIITYPTRTSKTNATLIDHIYCKSPNPLNVSDTGILVRKISDHMATFASFNFKINPNYKEINTIKTRPFTGRNMRNFQNDLNNTNWEAIFDHDISSNPTISYDQKFSVKLDELMDKHFPTKEIKFHKHKHKKSRWMTPQTLQLIEKRDKLYIKSLSTNPLSEEHNAISEQLISTGREVRKLIRENKTAFNKSELHKNKNDIKKTWGTITDILNKSKIYKAFPKIFHLDGHTIEGKSETASSFNNFFINIGPNLAKNIDIVGKPSFSSYLDNQKIKTHFTFTQINEESTCKLINAFKPKKSASCDNISGILLKFCATAITKPLTAIINQSLLNGIFPDKLKLAKVIPIYKKVDVHDLNNYRPISLLRTLSKIFERVVHTQLFHYFTKKTYFSTTNMASEKNTPLKLQHLNLLTDSSQILTKTKLPLPYSLTSPKPLTQ